MFAGAHGVAFCGEAEGVPAHGVQHVEALHGLETGDNVTDGPRVAGLFFTYPNVKSVVTGNYIDNSFIEWTNEHDAAPDFSSEFSFGGLTIAKLWVSSSSASATFGVMPVLGVSSLVVISAELKVGASLRAVTATGTLAVAVRPLDSACFCGGRMPALKRPGLWKS